MSRSRIELIGSRDIATLSQDTTASEPLLFIEVHRLGLTRETVQRILPLMQRWAATGVLLPESREPNKYRNRKYEGSQ